MAILDRLFPRRQASESLAGHTRVVGGIKMYSETPGVLFDRGTSSAGVVVDEYEALSIAAVFTACFRLANVAAMLPIGIYQKTPKGREELATHPASRCLNIETNPNSTAFTARWFMQFWKPLFGSAVAEIGWDGAGRLKYLWPLEPWRVYPEYDEHDTLHYVVDGRRKVAAGDMIYVPHVTEDGVCGKGFLYYAIDSLGQAIAADRSAGRLFENDMKPGGILEHPGSPNKEARKQMKEEWQLAHGGVKNRGKVGVVWGGWKYIKDTGVIDPDKAQLLETRQFSVTEVARWLNVPPHWVADLSRATFSNIEHQSIEALIYCIGPMLTAFEQEYDRRLLNPPTLYSKHNVNALLRADMKTRGEFYRLMREIGVETANGILALEDQNGIGSEGDRRFIPVNWQPADDLMTGGEAQRKAKEVAAPGVQPGANPPEPPAKPAPSPAKKGPSLEMLAGLQAVAESTVSWLLKKEVGEARKATKKISDLASMNAWASDFYAGFQATIVTALSPIARIALAMRDDSVTEPVEQVAERWAKAWVELSQADLRSEIIHGTTAWRDRSAALFTRWELSSADRAKWIAEQPLTPERGKSNATG